MVLLIDGLSLSVLTCRKSGQTGGTGAGAGAANSAANAGATSQHPPTPQTLLTEAEA
jgi:hypothetical protein